MPRFKLIIEYDGTNLAGWQKQVDRESVQGLLEKAVEKFCGAPCGITGAGRTDAGVHAAAQVAHVDIPREAEAYNVMHGINYHLDPLTSQVIIVAAERAADDFHARFSATARRYVYRIINRQARPALFAGKVWHIPEKLDAAAMREAAKLLLGHHDFSSFRSRECQSKSPLKTLDTFDVVQAGDEIVITAQSRSFLHHQVRNMVGTLKLVGEGRWRVGRVAAALAALDRAAAGPTAPAEGLCLVGVRYPVAVFAGDDQPLRKV
jgi:tRNA pseudouridine38-40 synthase